MEITTETLKMLRDKTGVSVMQCKKALEEASGDIEQAEVILRKRSGAAADKKSDRELGAGAVSAYVHVARNEEFPQLAREIAMQIAATNPGYLSEEEISEDARNAALAVFKEEVKDKPAEMQEQILEGKMKSYFKDQVLLEQAYIKDDSKTIRDLITEASQKFGERVEITRFSRFSAR